MSAKHDKPRKQPKAIWVKAYPEQHQALHPNKGLVAGLRPRSGSMNLLMAVYSAIRALFLRAEPICQICKLRGLSPAAWAEDVHHSRGRDGVLLFDVRWFKSACRACHDWAHAHPKEADKFGASDLANWGKETI